MATSAWIVGIGLGAAVLSAQSSSSRRLSTFDVVEKARVCSRSTIDPEQTDCEYRVGKALRFSIAGVGAVDAGIVFAKSDVDGDYYAAFGLQHSCVIVWPGAAAVSPKVVDLAFVSPVNGRVYRNWSSCADHR
jgi:hypothetical protein